MSSINLKKDSKSSNYLQDTNNWKIKNQDGKLISVPITSLSNKHLCAALTTAIDNVSNLTKEKEALEVKLNKLTKHIDTCFVNALNMQETLKSRNISFKYPIQNKLSKGLLHPEVAEVFFEDEYLNIKKSNLIFKLNTNEATPILQEIAEANMLNNE